MIPTMILMTTKTRRKTQTQILMRRMSFLRRVSVGMNSRRSPKNRNKKEKWKKK